MTNSLLAEQAELRARLSSTLQQLQARRNEDVGRDRTPGVYDVLVSPNEIIERHGTGAVLLRIFGSGNGFLSIRSRSQFGGHQAFGDLNFCLAHPTPHADVTEPVLDALKGRVPRRIISVPYFPDDVASTIALKNRFGVPLCTYIMDDQSLLVDHIPRTLMQTLLSLSDLRLGISQDLCEAYEAAYGCTFWFAPPVAPGPMVLGEPAIPADPASKRGVVLGNIWSQQWLDRLRRVTRRSGIGVDWFGNPNREWLSFEESDLAGDGISFMGYLPEEELVARLRQYPYAVLPTAISDDVSDRPELARLSLPSRITYLVATANTPIIVLGRGDGATARFLEHLDIGMVAPYRPTGFRAAVEHLCRPEVQQPMRIRAARVARALSAEGMAEWIWASLAKREAADSRFEDLMPRPRHIALRPGPSRGGALQDADVIITGNEITDKHGTGALVARIFATADNVLSIRSFNHYGGDHRFGDVSLCWGQWGLSRPQFFRMVADALRDTTIRRIFCVPYFREELLTAIALKDIYDVPLAAYIMDDQNVAVDVVPDALMREFLTKCSLRLATHPELRDAYEEKFGLKFWLLPAVVPDALIQSAPASPGDLPPSGPGALLGSLWSERWFDMLWRTIHGAGVSLDWYGNPTYEWLRDSPAELRRKGIHPRGLLAEGPLVERLRTHPFVVVPTGTLDERDDRPALGLSLPGRIIFAMATAHTPVIVLGSPRTPAARFVERFQIGAVCDYDPAAFRRAFTHLTQPDVYRRLRANAARTARAFSDTGITEWVWSSLERGEPDDSRFEDLMPRSPGDTVPFIEPPVPPHIYHHYVPVYHVMRRLRGQGMRPDFIIDVGASHGIWSYAASRAFPEARFILIDPLLSRYDRRAHEAFLQEIRHVETLEVAVSNRAGRTAFQVSHDLWGSSLLDPADFRAYETIEVEVDTLDNIARARSIAGRGLLKLDVQCAEHLVLEGARELLSRVDGVVVEVSLVRYDARALILAEMLNLLDGLGYRYYDETGVWRSPTDGTLLQKEIVFLRKDVLTPTMSRAIAP